MAGTNAKLLFVCFVALLSATSSYAACNVADGISLRYFAGEVVFNTQNEFASWIDGTDCCTWQGVTCNANGYVQYLHIANPDVVAPNPVGGAYFVGGGISTLQYLENLTMINLPLNGQMPDAWGALPNLKVLNIDGCNVAGSIPISLCLLTGLNTIILKDNLLSGDVPSCFSNPKSNFPAVTSFNVSGNPGLSGPVPPGF